MGLVISEYRKDIKSIKNVQHDRKGARKLEHAIKAPNLDFSASARLQLEI